MTASPWNAISLCGPRNAVSRFPGAVTRAVTRQAGSVALRAVQRASGATAPRRSGRVVIGRAPDGSLTAVPYTTGDLASAQAVVAALASAGHTNLQFADLLTLTDLTTDPAWRL